jgi:glycerophosphoryl diester phosphodiesterase
MINIPKIIGHRGAAAYAPENTIEGVHTTADMGVTWVELDVKLTKDDIPIIFHDDTLERTTNGHGNVRDYTYADLCDLDCGAWFSDGFYGTQIPALEDMIEVLIARDLGLNLEIKPCPGRDKDTAEIALDMMAQYWDAHDKLLISSFSYAALEVALDMANDWPRGLLLPPNIPENWSKMVDFFDPATVNISEKSATRNLCTAIIDKGKQILAYTVNDPVRARELQAMGVDGIFTDTPDVIEDSLLVVH